MNQSLDIDLNEIELRYKSNWKIFKHKEWLEKYATGEKVYPICWEIDPSNRCQYNCTYCCWGDLIAGSKDIIPRDRLITLVHEIKALEGKAIIWSGGGDPLTHPNIAEVVQLSCELGIENGMFTNGRGMHSQNAELLARSLEWIRFHVNGDSIETFAQAHKVPANVFETVIDNIERFIAVKDRTAQVMIGTAVNPETFEGAKGLPQLAMDIGADYFQAKIDLQRVDSYEYMEWWFEEAVPYFQQEKSRLDGRVRIFSDPKQESSNVGYCHAHRVITAITADGRVAFCKMWRDHPKTSLGNIHDHKLQDIIGSKRHQKLANAITAKGCRIYDVYCPYRKTIQAIELHISDPENVPSIPEKLPHVNFF